LAIIPISWLLGSRVMTLIRGIEFHRFKGNWEGLEFRSKNIYVDNLTNPVLRCDITSAFDLITLNSLLGSNAIDLTGGTGQLAITYKGPLMDNTNITPEVNGSLELEKGLLLYIPRNVQLSNCKGSIFFSGSDVSVLNLYCEAGDNKITMNGKAAKLLTLIKADPSKVELDWNIYSPALNLKTFAGLIKARSKRKSTIQKAKLGSISSQLDNMLDVSNVKINLKTDKLLYNRFTASDVHANIYLNAENWTLNEASLRHAGGNMLIKGSVNGAGNDHQAVNLKAVVNNMDVTRLMYAFNNFGQDGIVSDNIKGNLSANTEMKMMFAVNNGVVEVKNMNGVVDFIIKKGELLDYEPLKKLQGIFKTRDFDHVYFAELKDRLDINDGEITINPLEIDLAHWLFM
jgi:small nuclear ribonucleoprotein (snRNP)-like protein